MSRELRKVRKMGGMGEIREGGIFGKCLYSSGPKKAAMQTLQDATNKIFFSIQSNPDCVNNKPEVREQFLQLVGTLNGVIRDYRAKFGLDGVVPVGNAEGRSGGYALSGVGSSGYIPYVYYHPHSFYPVSHYHPPSQPYPAKHGGLTKTIKPRKTTKTTKTKSKRVGGVGRASKAAAKARKY